MVRGAGVVLVSAMLLMSCGSAASPKALDSSVSASTVPPTPNVPTTLPETTLPDTTVLPETTVLPTTAPQATTAAPTTMPPATLAPTTDAPITDAPTTTAALVTIADLVLQPDGIGPLTFGTPAETVLAALSPLFGAPVQNTASQYPVDMGDSTFQSVDGELSFVQPFGRYVCFSVSLRIWLGGATPDALNFTGWYFFDNTSSTPLVTADGIGIGSRWADFSTVIDVFEGGCYSSGNGESNGVQLSLYSSGAWFTVFDENGKYINTTPDPADVTVTAMNAGDSEIYLNLDC